MNDPDLVFPILWVISSLVILIYSIVTMIKTKDSETFITAFLLCLIAFTPGSLLIGFALLFFGFMMVLRKISELLFKLKDEEDEE